MTGPLAASATLAAFIAAVGIAAWSGLVTGNATGSVPRGLYIRSTENAASHVSFCLSREHRAAPWYPRFCSPDNPDGIRLLKRIAGRREDGNLIVEGDTPRSLDSRRLGPVDISGVRGWWRPLAVI